MERYDDFMDIEVREDLPEPAELEGGALISAEPVSEQAALTVKFEDTQEPRQEDDGRNRNTGAVPDFDDEDDDEEEELEGLVEFRLRSPVEYEGRTLDTITLNLDGLSVSDILRCEREAKFGLNGKKRKLKPILEVDKHYLACVAARAANERVDLIYQLSGKDFTKITRTVGNFLLT